MSFRLHHNARWRRQLEHEAITEAREAQRHDAFMLKLPEVIEDIIARGDRAALDALCRNYPDMISTFEAARRRIDAR